MWFELIIAYLVRLFRITGWFLMVIGVLTMGLMPDSELGRGVFDVLLGAFVVWAASTRLEMNDADPWN